MAKPQAASTECKIMKCTCEHPYQDQKYGKSMRVHNAGGGSKTKVPVYSCTICKASRSN